MEADLLHGLDQSAVYPYKSHIIRNPMKIHQSLISPTDIPSAGLLRSPPPSLLHSRRPYSLQPPPQPPLLPLPTAPPRRSPSCSPANRNGDRRGDHAFTPKKSKYQISKKSEEQKTPKRSSNTVTVSSTSNFGPDSKLGKPKNIGKTSHFDSTGDIYSNDVSVIDSSVAGSVVFTICPPPPSSLPLPSFSLRPKLSCNAVVAAGVDNGSTDNLRRLLRRQ